MPLDMSSLEKSTLTLHVKSGKDKGLVEIAKIRYPPVKIKFYDSHPEEVVVLPYLELTNDMFGTRIAVFEGSEDIQEFLSYYNLKN